MDRPTQMACESSRKPPASHSTKDWRPVLEEKMQRMLYNLGTSKAFGGESKPMYMEEAHDTNKNTANIENCDYTTAISPGAVVDASSVEEARKHMIKALQHRTEEIDSIARDHSKTSSRELEDSKEKCLNELALLHDYVAPRRTTTLRTIDTVDPVEHLAQSADPTPLLRTTEETHPDSPRPGSPHAVAPITAASIHAMLRERSPRHDGVKGRGSRDSDASTVRSASNAATWRSQSKYDDSAEEEQQEEEGKRGQSPIPDSAGTLTELEEFFSAPGLETSGRRDSALAGLEETQRGEPGGKEKAKPPAADRRSAPSSALDSLPVSEGGRSRPTKKQNLKQNNTKQQREHEEPASESAVLEPARHTRPPTKAEKGKWAAKCECPMCQPQRPKHVRFDESAMDKAEDGPGLSHEGFVKNMRENRRRMEAEERGEGASSWATSGPAGLDMFTNPRPAPPVPVRRQGNIGRSMEQNRTVQPMGRYGVFPRVHEFPSRPSHGTRSRVTPLGEADAMVQMDGRKGQQLWRALSHRFRK